MQSQRLLRFPEVMTRTGLSRPNIYERIADGTFPPSIKLGPRSVAFVEAEVEQWIEQQIRASRTEAA